MEYNANIIQPVQYCKAPQDKYRSTEMSKMQSLIKRLKNATMNLFACIEHENIPPANNAAKCALRDVVVCRKISGQIRGSESMRRMSNFLTYVLIKITC